MKRLTIRSRSLRLETMKAKSKDPATNEAQERFEKFGKALMAVPKKELDKELAKHERERRSPKRQKQKM
jgi:hypothetical protein